ncbi:hypothetical protein Tco_0894930 [Tanacetum coccineum]|uniref:Uncharacterized protein n=1 Tax=Tanacetum coccineum TaxID=301880 RepID=A0ABQ5CFS2_9ASTR
MPSFPSPEPTVSYLDDLDFLKDFKNEFPAIVYNDALTSKSDSSTEPVEIPHRIDEFDLKDETSFSECDEEEQNVLYFNDLFPFNIIYPDDSKSDKDNDDHEIDIKQSLRGRRNVINTDDGVYAHGSNKLLETSHDKSNKFFKAKTFIKELNVNIMTWNHLNKGMSFIFLNKEFFEYTEKEIALVFLYLAQDRTEKKTTILAAEIYSTRDSQVVSEPVRNSDRKSTFNQNSYTPTLNMSASRITRRKEEIPPPTTTTTTTSIIITNTTQQTPHTVSTIKLPILKKGEYDI